MNELRSLDLCSDPLPGIVNVRNVREFVSASITKCQILVEICCKSLSCSIFFRFLTNLVKTYHSIDAEKINFQVKE